MFSLFHALFGTDRSERGASLVLLSASLVLLLGIAAVAVDLAGLRLDRRADRLASDAAVTAGISEIDPFAGTGVVEACKTAWAYILINLEDEGTSLNPPDCETVFADQCDPATAREAHASAGPYSFVITQPVPDDHELMGDQAINPLIDGESCQRMGVTIHRTREHAFANILGMGTGATTVHTVGRSAAEAGSGEVVPLLVLEPIDCGALFTSGQGKVTVSFDDVTDTPGFIVVDSNASTCSSSNPYSIDSKGNQKGWIRAIPNPDPLVPSAILSYALADIGNADPAAAYDPDDLTDPVDPADITDPDEPEESWYRLYPKPQAISQRITRAPIDWRYNCKTGYDLYLLDTSDPGLGGVKIHDCPDAATSTAYIDRLTSTYEAGTGQPFVNVWTSTYPCSVASDISVTGDWYVDCPGGFVVNGVNVTFGGSNIVFDGGIDLKSTASLKINENDGGNYFVYLREGTILKRAQSSLVLEQTFVYLENGKIDLRAGDGGLTWIAPVAAIADPGGGDPYDFEDLALWSEANLTHEIGGQAGNSLTGTFFTPYAEPFILTGQGGQFQLQAQFITRRLEVKGQGEVKMHPDPDKSTAIPIRAVKLIR